MKDPHQRTPLPGKSTAGILILRKHPLKKARLLNVTHDECVCAGTSVSKYQKTVPDNFMAMVENQVISAIVVLERSLFL